MINKSIVKCSLMIIIFMSSGLVALAKDIDYSLLPVEITPTTASSDRGKLRITFSQPCGADFQGFAVHRRDKDTLQIGAVVAIRPSMCLGLGRTTSMPFALAPYGRYVSFDPLKLKGPIKLARVEEVRAVRSGSHTKLQIIHETNSCNQRLGALIYHRSHRELAVGYLETGLWNKRAKKNCKLALKIYDTPNLNLAPSTKIEKVRPTAMDLKTAYRLKLAKVNLPTVSQDVKGLKIPYSRRCNEAPVGVVLEIEPTTGHMKLGMLVAYYYNYRCPAGGMKRTHQEYLLPGVSLPASLTYSTIALARYKTSDFYLTSPTSLNTSPGITVNHFGSCNRTVGLIMAAAEKSATVRLGILKRGNPSSCKIPAKEVSLKLPLKLNRATSEELKSFSLVGA